MNLCHRLLCLSLFCAVCGLAQAAAPRHSLALPPVWVPPVGEFVVPSEMPAQAEITRLPAELITQFQTEVLAKASSQDARLERLVADMDFVPREEFEAVKAMAAKARMENDALAARLLDDRP